MFAMAGYGGYHFKNRKVPASVYLMQYRVQAQGVVVGAMIIGVAYNLVNNYLHPKTEEELDAQYGRHRDE